MPLAKEPNRFHTINFMIPSLLPTEYEGSTVEIPELDKENGTNLHVLYAEYDQTTEEYLNGYFEVPPVLGDGGLDVEFSVFCTPASAASSNNVGFTFGHRPVADNEAWDGALTEEDSGAVAISNTAGNLNRISWTETLTNLGWNADELILFRLSRDPSVASDFAGDLRVFNLRIKIPIR